MLCRHEALISQETPSSKLRSTVEERKVVSKNRRKCGRPVTNDWFLLDHIWQVQRGEVKFTNFYVLSPDFLFLPITTVRRFHSSLA